MVTFNGDGTFSQTETGSITPGVSTGSYAFTSYGPLGAMLVLTYSGGVEAGACLIFRPRLRACGWAISS